MAYHNVFTLNMIPKEMMTYINMLRARMLHRIMSNFDSTLIVTEEWNLLDMNTIILHVCLSHRICVQQEPTTIYSASAVEIETQFCFFEAQHTRDLPRKWHVPEVDFLSTLSPAQSESEYPIRLN